MPTERHIASVSESSLADVAVFSQSKHPHVRIESFPVEDDPESRLFSVEGDTLLERDAIAMIMARRTHSWGNPPDWRDINSGLKDISYPSRKVRRMAQVANLGSHLSAIQPSVRELSSILDHNQNYWTQAVNVPVFNYSQSHQYVADVLTVETSERRLLSMVKSLGMDPDIARKLSRALSTSVIQLDDVVAQLEQMTGMSELETAKIQNAAILDLLEPRNVAELIERLRSQYFTGFKVISTYDRLKLQGGTDETEAYILDEDLPVNLRSRAKDAKDDPEGINDLFEDVRISISGPLRDSDKKRQKQRTTPEDRAAEDDEERKRITNRYRVVFGKQAPRYAARAKLFWQRRPNPERPGEFIRELRFPAGLPVVNGLEENLHVRPNSLVGATLAACVLGNKIDYDNRLSRMYNPRASYSEQWRFYNSNSIVGMWPLVASHKEQELLSAPYFKEIEERLE